MTRAEKTCKFPQKLSVLAVFDWFSYKSIGFPINRQLGELKGEQTHFLSRMDHSARALFSLEGSPRQPAGLCAAEPQPSVYTGKVGTPTNCVHIDFSI